MAKDTSTRTEGRQGRRDDRRSDRRDDDGRERESRSRSRSTRIAAERARGNLDGVITILERHVEDVEADNADLRQKNRDLRDDLEDAQEVPEGKVLVDKTAWESAEQSHKALTELGVDADTLKTAFPKGRDALLGMQVDGAKRAHQLSDDGAGVLRQLVIDNKLTLATDKETKDGKTSEQTYVVGADGKKAALKDYLTQHHAAYAPAVFASGKATGSGDAPAPEASPRRMSVNAGLPARKSASGESSGATDGDTRKRQQTAAGAVLKRYVVPGLKKEQPAGT